MPNHVQIFFTMSINKWEKQMRITALKASKHYLVDRKLKIWRPSLSIMGSKFSP
jgi:N-acetyl-anhydromuramyl-L-alanine amidase AmpD